MAVRAARKEQIRQSAVGGAASNAQTLRCRGLLRCHASADCIVIGGCADPR